MEIERTGILTSISKQNEAHLYHLYVVQSREIAT